ncbi:MAG TPA: ROK family protein [Ktedonobacterales bacterium]|nr:ROK family protein [Ktedonobacterales bacterium]
MYLAIDIGGSTTRVGCTSDLHSSRIELIEQFPTHHIFAVQMKTLLGVLAAVRREPLVGVGISLGGHIASDGLSVRDAANLRDYEGKPLVALLQEAAGCPVRLAHDTVCGLLAEKSFGALAPFDLCAYLTVSTGTGAAIQLRKAGQALAVSIEMGHQLLAGNTRPCLCGQVGCLETITGGRQIALRFGREAAQIDDITFWQEFTEALALGILNLARLTRAEAIAISGGIALNVPYLREHLPGSVAVLCARDVPQLFWSQLGQTAPLLGAAVLLDTPEAAIIH